MDISIETLIGTSFLKKRSHNEKDKESMHHTDDCSIEEIKNASFVGLLFSSGWCPPCKTFLNILKDFYNEVNIDKKKCEVVYVPMDKSEDDYKEHYSHMPWLSIPFNDPRVHALR